MSKGYIYALNVIRSAIWLCTSMPLAITGSCLLVLSSAIEHIIRWGTDWHPFHPIRSVGSQASQDDVQPPVRVDE